MNKGAIKKRRLKVLMTEPAKPKNAATKETLLPAGLSKSESCDGDLARHFDEVDCETQLKQAFVHQYVGRRSRGVAVYHKAAAHETLGEYSRQYGKEIKSTGNPGLEPQRRFCN